MSGQAYIGLSRPNVLHVNSGKTWRNVGRRRLGFGRSCLHTQTKALRSDFSSPYAAGSSASQWLFMGPRTAGAQKEDKSLRDCFLMMQSIEYICVSYDSVCTSYSAQVGGFHGQ